MIRYDQAPLYSFDYPANVGLEVDYPTEKARKEAIAKMEADGNKGFEF